MQPDFNIRRLSDGSIDFEFYCRRAIRERRRKNQVLVARLLASVATALRLGVSAIETSSRGRSASLLRTSAAAAVIMTVALVGAWTMVH
jgi:hypothetical protein